MFGRINLAAYFVYHRAKTAGMFYACGFGAKALEWRITMQQEEVQKVSFTDENGEEILFYVLEQTRIGAVNYLLVTDSLTEEEAEALILKETGMSEDEDLVYDIVEDDTELAAISKVFGELLEDIDIEM